MNKGKEFIGYRKKYGSLYNKRKRPYEKEKLDDH